MHDRIEKPHMLSLYKRALSLRVDQTTARNAAIGQLTIPRIVSLILTRGSRRNPQQNAEEFKGEFRQFWNENVKPLSNDLMAAIFQLVKFWRLHSEEGVVDSLAELNVLVAQEDKKSLIELFKTDKLGEELKQFFDQTKGAKARLIYMLHYQSNAHAFVMKNQELAQLIVGDLLSEDQISDELTKAYLQWFTDKSEAERDKGHLAADLLLQIRKLNLKFDQREAVRKPWALCITMFLIFVDQLADAKPEFVHRFGAHYKHMMYTLHQHTSVKGQKTLDFGLILGKHVQALKEYDEAEYHSYNRKAASAAKSPTAKCPTPEYNRGVWPQSMISGAEDEKTMKKWLQEDHWNIFLNTAYGNRLKQNLGLEGMNRMDAFILGDEPGWPSSTNKEYSSSSSPLSAASSSSSASNSKYYFKCPNQSKTMISPSDEGFDQLLPYKMYLVENITDEYLKYRKEVINLYTAIWRYQKIISDLFERIDGNFQAEKPKEFAKLREDWDTMVNWKITDVELEAEDKELEKKLCKLFVIVHRLCDFLLQMAVENPGELQAETVLMTMQIKSQFPIELMNSPNIPKNMIKNLDLELENFKRLNWLFKEYRIFNLFFCDQPSSVKDKLFKLIGAKPLEELERRHPDVLKISEPQDNVRYHLYEQFVVNRKGSDEATDAELRLIFRMSLISKLRWVEQLKPAEFLSEYIQQIVQRKTDWLKEMIFVDPSTIASALNICRLFHYKSYIEEYGKLDKGEHQDEILSALMIEQWAGVMDCGEQKKVEKTLTTVKKEFTVDHLSFFRASIMKSEIRKLMYIRGYMTRFKRLIPNLNTVFQPNLLIDHAFVRELIGKSLLEKDEEKREMNRVGLGFASWFRSIDAELIENKKKPLGQRVLHDLWNETGMRQKVLRKFDEIFDAHLTELRGHFGLVLARMQAQVWDLVEKWRKAKGPTKEKMLETIKPEFNKAMEQPDDAVLQRWKGKKDLEKLLQRLNQKEMLTQLTRMPDEQDKKKNEEYIVSHLWQLELKDELEENKAARKRLPVLFGGARHELGPILAAIPLEEEAIELGFVEKKQKGKTDNRHNKHDKGDLNVDARTASSSNTNKPDERNDGDKTISLLLPEMPSSTSTKNKKHSKPSKKQRNKARKTLNPETVATVATEDSGSKAASPSNLSSEEEAISDKESEVSASMENLTQSSTDAVTKAVTEDEGEEGEWEEAKGSKKKQAKMAHAEQLDASSIIGSSSSSIPQGQRQQKQSQAGIKLSEYIAVAKSSGAEKKKKAADVVVEDNSVIADEQLAPIKEESEKESEKEALAKTKQKPSPWAPLVPAEDQTLAPPKLAESLTNSTNGKEASEETVEETVVEEEGWEEPKRSKKKHIKLLKIEQLHDAFVGTSSSTREYHDILPSKKPWEGPRQSPGANLSEYIAVAKPMGTMKKKKKKTADILVDEEIQSSAEKTDLNYSTELTVDDHLASMKDESKNESEKDALTTNAKQKSSLSATLEPAQDQNVVIPKLAESSKLAESLMSIRANEKEASELEAKVGKEKRVDLSQLMFGSIDPQKLLKAGANQKVIKRNEQKPTQPHNKGIILSQPRESSSIVPKSPLAQITSHSGQAAPVNVVEEKVAADDDELLLAPTKKSEEKEKTVLIEGVRHAMLLRGLSLSENKADHEFENGLTAQVKWMHANPKRLSNKNSACPPDEEIARLSANGNKWLYTIWLVGIQLMEGGGKDGNRQFLKDKLKQMDFTEEPNEAARDVGRHVEEQEIGKQIRLEHFTQKIYGSFKNRRVSSPRSLHRSNSNVSTSTNSAESPRGNAVSPRNSPNGNSAESPRLSMLSRQNSTPSPSIGRQDSIPGIGETETEISEKVWAKYLDKKQLQAWLHGMGAV